MDAKKLVALLIVLIVILFLFAIGGIFFQDAIGHGVFMVKDFLNFKDKKCVEFASKIIPDYVNYTFKNAHFYYKDGTQGLEIIGYRYPEKEENPGYLYPFKAEDYTDEYFEYSYYVRSEYSNKILEATRFRAKVYLENNPSIPLDRSPNDYGEFKVAGFKIVSCVVGTFR